MRKRWESKRRGHRDETNPGKRDDRAPQPEDEELQTRLDAVTSRFDRPPTPEELRAAFARKSTDAKPSTAQQNFASSFPVDSLFVPTIDEPIEIPSEFDDRSKSRGDYYYDPDDAWAVLGVAPGAVWSDIAAAHRKLAKVHHPDRLLDATHEEREASEAAMRNINVAYSVLRRLTGN